MLPGNANGRKARSRASAKELIKEVQLEPAAKSLVEQIVLAYERKEFLPELRHVRQYLEEAGKDVSELRFRAEALPEVIAILSTYSHDRLGKLVESFKYTGGRNDLEILTNQRDTETCRESYIMNQWRIMARYSRSAA